MQARVESENVAACTPVRLSAACSPVRRKMRRGRNTSRGARPCRIEDLRLEFRPSHSPHSPHSRLTPPTRGFSFRQNLEARARSPTRVFFVPPSRHLLCSLCDENFNEVVLPCAGGHTFCRECVLRWFERQRTCPECRAVIPASFTAATMPANRLVKAMVDELRVRCCFGLKEEGDGLVADEAGCPAQLTLDGAAAHEAT